MVSVADSFEVMTAARSYKRPMDVKAARLELTNQAGTQFDPAIVRAFLNISIGRMRWMAGPLAWVFQLPFLERIPGGAAGQAAGVAARVVAGAAVFTGIAAPAAPAVGAPDTHTVAQQRVPAATAPFHAPASDGAPAGDVAPTTVTTGAPG